MNSALWCQIWGRSFSLYAKDSEVRRTSHRRRPAALFEYKPVIPAANTHTPRDRGCGTLSIIGCRVYQFHWREQPVNGLYRSLIRRVSHQISRLVSRPRGWLYFQPFGSHTDAFFAIHNHHGAQHVHPIFSFVAVSS